jgi:hypothetical protein
MWKILNKYKYTQLFGGFKNVSINIARKMSGAISCYATSAELMFPVIYSKYPYVESPLYMFIRRIIYFISLNCQ